MNIGTRIFGGFTILLFLTISVAFVGWHGLSRFTRRTEAASAAQNVVDAVGVLAVFSAELTVPNQAAGRVDVAKQQIAAVRAAVAGIAPFLPSEGMERPAGKMNEAIDAYDAALKKFDQYRDGKAKLQTQQQDVLERLIAVATTIKTDHEEAGKRALDRLKAAGAELEKVTESAEALAVGTKIAGYLQANDDANLLLRASGETIAAALLAQSVEAALFNGYSDSADAVTVEAASAMIDNASKIRARIADEKLKNTLGGLLKSIEDFRNGIPEVFAASVGQNQARQDLEKRLGELVSLARSVGDVEQAAMRVEREQALVLLGIGVSLAIVLGVVLSILIGRSISRPVFRLSDAMRALADGDLDAPVPATDRRDEVGVMARTVVVFKDALASRAEARLREAADADSKAQRTAYLEALADEFQEHAVGLINALSSAASGLRGTATAMSGAAERTNTRSIGVAEAATHTSTNVSSVAAAAEELSASTHEIGRQVDMSNGIASSAVRATDQARQTVEGLAGAVANIGSVVALISGIAAKTNLLALNATIEAARAGETGRGFAVVASEVKDLANQTARATSEIAVQIAQIQEETGSAVAAIRDASGVIERMSGITAEIATAVEQQGLAAQEIAHNVSEASTATGVVASSIAEVMEAAQDTGEAATKVLANAVDLQAHSVRLENEVGRFLGSIKAA